MPPWLRPTPAQCFLPHFSSIEYLAWYVCPPMSRSLHVTMTTICTSPQVQYLESPRLFCLSSVNVSEPNYDGNFSPYMTIIQSLPSLSSIMISPSSIKTPLITNIKPGPASATSSSTPPTNTSTSYPPPSNSNGTTPTPICSSTTP